MIEKKERVHRLNHYIFVLVDFFWHLKLNSDVAEGKQCTNRHLLREVLMLLDEHKRDNHKHSVVFKFTKGVKIAHTVRWCFL